ncbi:hypothetical protein ACLOJK_018864, partial [Asimina triloba]
SDRSAARIVPSHVAQRGSCISRKGEGDGEASLLRTKAGQPSGGRAFYFRRVA